MLNRTADPAGKAKWVAELDSGEPLEAVIAGISGSIEFHAVCGQYGIRPEPLPAE